jgi:hypothetical protein
MLRTEKQGDAKEEKGISARACWRRKDSKFSEKGKMRALPVKGREEVCLLPPNTYQEALTPLKHGTTATPSEERRRKGN